MQGIVLLSGVRVVQSVDRSSTHELSLPGGVLPFTDNFLQTTSTFLRMHAREMFGSIGNFSIWDRPTILDASSPPCSSDSIGCLSQHVHYFLQKLQYQDNDAGLTADTPAVLELPRVPMYQILLTERSGTPSQICKLYGVRNARLRLCAETIEENGRNLTSIGMYTSKITFGENII